MENGGRCVLRQLMYGYLRDACRDAEVFRPSVWKLGDLLNAMTYREEWAAFFDYLSEQIQQQTRVRDDLQGEKRIQVFLRAWLNHLTQRRQYMQERRVQEALGPATLHPLAAGLQRGWKLVKREEVTMVEA